MFTDQFIRQRSAQSSSSQPPPPNGYPVLPKQDYMMNRQAKDLKAFTRTHHGPQRSTDLSCKSQIGLSMLRQQALPSRVRLKQHVAKTQTGSKCVPQSTKKSSITPGQRLKQSTVTPEHVRRQSCPNQSSLQKRHHVQSMPEVLTSTKPPVVFSPQHPRSKNQTGSRNGSSRLSIAGRFNHSADVLPNAFGKRSSSTYNAVSDDLRGRFPAHTRNRSVDSTSTCSSTSKHLSVPSRSSDSSDTSVGLERMSLDSRSAYGYVYDNVPVQPRHSIGAMDSDHPKPHYGSKQSNASRSSSRDKTILSPGSQSSNGCSRRGYKPAKSWKKLADSATLCMGEGIIFEDEETSSYGKIHDLDSIDDAESFQDNYSQILDEDLEEFNEGDFEDDLTDLESDDGQSYDDTGGRITGSTISRAQSSDPLTFVRWELDIERQKDCSTFAHGGGVRTSSSYQGALLVAEVDRRRERDFGNRGSKHGRSVSTDAEDDRCKYRMRISRSSHNQTHSSERENAAERTRNEITRPDSYISASRDGANDPIGTSQTRPQQQVTSYTNVPSVQSLSEPTPPGSSTGTLETSRHCDVARIDHLSSSPLTPSMFPDHLPPTIHFPLHNENYIALPKDKRALLKWKMSPITPNVVKNCIARVGFTKCTRGTAWLGYWGKHMKAESFKTVKEYQKVNHFPGTFEIGRKDRLWRNLSKLQARVGRKELDFVPLTFVLPQDIKQLRKEWDEGGTKQKWILKPPAAARGIGIRVVSKWGQIPKKKPVVVQRYLSDPYLINGSKFDLRVYVHVSSYDPLRIYVFKEGLARFATCKYSSAMKHLSNRFMHLTNYSINKRNSDFTPNTDETVCQGHKWGLLALWRYMEAELGVDTGQVWGSITDLVAKTIICSEPFVTSNVKAHVRNPYSVHELFGFDVMLDRHLKPWILEVNISPSLHSNSQLDVNIKGRLVRDLFNITGFTLPTRDIVSGEKRTTRRSLTTEERIKHSTFVQRSLPQTERKTVLDSLTEDDLLMLMKSEDELSRCGNFERVYPCSNYDKFRRLFEVERYYNILLGEWAARFQKCPKKGISVLQKHSKKLLSQTIK